MSNASRTVRHLRLRANAPGTIHQAALLLEDALRTASLPDAAARIVLVRKLALGRIDSRASPQTLALAVERSIKRLDSACVYAGATNAPDAPAVWFRDALDAHLQLALRLAAGDGVDAWYWPLAVAAWQPHVPLRLALRRLVFSLAALPEAPTALPRWTAAMVAAGHTEQVVAALRSEDVAPLARAAHVRVHEVTATRRGSQAQSASATSSRHVPGAKTRAGTAHTDLRRVLVRALMRAAYASTAPGPLSDDVDDVTDQPETRVCQFPDLGAVEIPSRSLPGRGGYHMEAHGRTRTDESTARAGRADAPRTTARWTTRRHRELEPEASPHSNLSVQQKEERKATVAAMHWASSRTSTCAGGLLFLIPVLQRLGYPEWLESQSGWRQFDIAQRVWDAVLRRLQVAREDPAWHLAAYRPATRSAPGRFVAPGSWREGLCAGDGRFRRSQSGTVRALWDASGRLLVGAWSNHCPRPLMHDWRHAEPRPATEVDPDRAGLVTTAWTVAARRWLRRFAGIGLSDLVLRRAELALTPTHADVFFELDQVDLRIRRAGLDIDPGWTPWLGRVLTVHYDR